MYNFFVWMFLIGMLLFSVISIVFALIGKRPRMKRWGYILIGSGAISIVGIVGMIITLMG